MLNRDSVETIQSFDFGLTQEKLCVYVMVSVGLHSVAQKLQRCNFLRNHKRDQCPSMMVLPTQLYLFIPLSVTLTNISRSQQCQTLLTENMTGLFDQLQTLREC